MFSHREMALHMQLDQDAELQAATFLEMVVTASIQWVQLKAAYIHTVEPLPKDTCSDLCNNF